MAFLGKRNSDIDTFHLLKPKMFWAEEKMGQEAKILAQMLDSLEPIHSISPIGVTL